MQVFVGLFILLLTLALLFMTFMSYPTAIMYFALKIYRHARSIKQMQDEQTRRVTQDWIAELEKHP